MNLPYQTILDGAALGTFWEFVKYFLFFIAPLVMIWVAIELVGRLLKIIKGTTENVDDDDYYDRRRRYDDDYD